ncbi:cysteine hydrolase family protein [Teichococcus oryzae]|uniref:Cysteine hydrolase n=1 Tax=Teichococcus oryzae TaxID=1608942 RepID=A0A5B2TEJ6_9PROT|nr:cysteine hydrolase [Pseudoroseomonas oryzae]KAA2212455.1 cysteine hydrolase [Pseudoroseomonas oryzae]
MADREGLRHGPLGPNVLHLCIDMQRLFAEGPWETPWLKRVLPVVEELACARLDRTLFTRFIPPARPEEMRGAWRQYYQHWSQMTLEALPPGQTDLLPELARLVPPAEVLDKAVYSPWTEPDLHRRLQQRSIDTLIITGAETDVCVLAAVLGAVDLGYRVVVPVDAICSSSDHTHDALLALYRERFGQQVEAVRTPEVLKAWR